VTVLNEICTILKPTLDDTGKIVFDDFGDCFYAIKRGYGERYMSGYYTHKAVVEMDGVVPGDLMITPLHDYIVVSVDKKNNSLGLVVKV